VVSTVKTNQNQDLFKSLLLLTVQQIQHIGYKNVRNNAFVLKFYFILDF